MTVLPVARVWNQETMMYLNESIVTRYGGFNLATATSLRKISSLGRSLGIKEVAMQGPPPPPREADATISAQQMWVSKNDD